ncbi:MAG: VapC toxin family PIN domain ribonuclease [Thermoprotei archaeon]|nr:MAG: VapC toxin family PIN domain ribonuclease [Thermoprotei archaeon]
MIYLDTSLIISYVDEEDPHHANAEEFVESLGSEKRVISPLVLVELASVYSRASLENPLQLAFYSVELVRAELMDIDFNEVLKQSLMLAPKLKLRTLDLLHIVACHVAKVEKFATLDKEITSKSEAISNLLRIKVLTE